MAMADNTGHGRPDIPEIQSKCGVKNKEQYARPNGPGRLRGGTGAALSHCSHCKVDIVYYPCRYIRLL